MAQQVQSVMQFPVLFSYLKASSLYHIVHFWLLGCSRVQHPSSV
jgi:hypothetical protein